MKRIMFDITEEMNEKIEAVMHTQGFMSRAEFLRYLVMNYTLGIPEITQKEPEHFGFGLSPELISAIKKRAGVE